jgi:hypothetical protein
MHTVHPVSTSEDGLLRDMYPHDKLIREVAVETRHQRMRHSLAGYSTPRTVKASIKLYGMDVMHSKADLSGQLGIGCSTLANILEAVHLHQHYRLL